MIKVESDDAKASKVSLQFQFQISLLAMRKISKLRMKFENRLRFTTPVQDGDLKPHALNKGSNKEN